MPASGADLYARRACVVLYDEHRKVQRLLNMHAPVLVMEARPEDFAGGLTAVLDGLFRELPGHFAKEEEGLFPVLESVMGKPFPPVEVMKEEHRVVRDHLTALHDARERLAKNPTHAEGRAAALRHAPALMDTLNGHIEKEDQVLLHIAGERLTEAHDQKVLRVYDEVDRTGRKW